MTSLHESVKNPPTDRAAEPEFCRRRFLHTASTAAGGALFGWPQLRLAAAEPKGRPKVAAIFTVFRPRSHAHVILENFLEPYLFNGRWTDPRVDVVSFYADQFPTGDMSRRVARQYNIPMYKTIEEALCLGGGQLAVDAVLAIGEHGDYPVNELGQKEYPRKRFFDQITAVMQRSGRCVPMFNDKHLSYRWDLAKQMYDVARQLAIPLMAGSSVPLAPRRPPLELPSGAVIEEAVSIHGGPPESYDFHGLEVLESLVEFRRGGETGVSRVEFLQDEALWSAADDGRWSPPLAEAAIAAELGHKPPPLRQIAGQPPAKPHAMLLTYKDGLKATVLKIGSSSTRWSFACKLKDDPELHATSFYTGPYKNRMLFKALAHAIQHHFIHRRAPYPVERTLLNTGVLQAAMQSRKQTGQPVRTPHLEFAYRARDFRAMRELGASYNIITPDLPESEGLKAAGGIPVRAQ